MINPYIIIGLLVAWACSLAGVGAWQRHDGAVTERTAWQQREIKQQAAVTRKIKELEEKARKTEQTHAAAQAEISTEYQRKLKDANQQRANDHAAVHAGTLRLRDPNPPGLRTLGCIPGQIPTTTSGRDGETGGGLSRESADFLLGLASEADDVTRQLEACQGVVLQDRAVE